MYNINDTLKLKNSSMCGIVTSIINSNSCTKYKLIINNKVVIINEDLIEKKIKNIPSNNTFNEGCKIIYSHNFTPEIMIRHLTKDEAILELERFIDKAICNKAKIIKIIHGKNGGILRKITNEFLSASPYVETFRLGYPHEGSYGVTIAKLK